MIYFCFPTVISYVFLTFLNKKHFSIYTIHFFKNNYNKKGAFVIKMSFNVHTKFVFLGLIYIENAVTV